MKSNQSVAWDLPGGIHNQQESRNGMRERLLGIGGKIPGTRMQRDQSLSSEMSSFDCRAQSRMDKRIRDRVEVKLPLCWDLTPNLIGSVRLTQCLLLPTWKEPKLLKVKCGFPEDCVSMCLLNRILSPLLLYLNSVVPTDLPCWCVSHQTSLFRSFYFCTACPDHISGKCWDSVSCEVSAMPCYDRTLGLCTQTCCVKLAVEFLPLGFLVSPISLNPLETKVALYIEKLRMEHKTVDDECINEYDLWENNRIWKNLFNFFFKKKYSVTVLKPQEWSSKDMIL